MRETNVEGDQVSDHPQYRDGKSGQQECNGVGKLPTLATKIPTAAAMMNTGSTSSSNVSTPETIPEASGGS